MGISVSEDEQDKKIRGMREERKEIVRRHANDTNAPAEMQAREWQIDRTAWKNPDPKYAYRLVDRRKEGEKINLRKGQGYEVVPDDAKEQWNASAKVDGCQVQGDLVAMRIPIEQYEEHKALRRRKWQFMSGQRTAEAKENINKIARDAGLVGRHKDAVIE